MTSEELHKLCCEKEGRGWTYAYNYVIWFLRDRHVSDQNIMDFTHDTILYFMEGGIQLIENPRAFKKWLRLKAWAFFIDSKRRERPREPLEVEDEDGKALGQNPAIQGIEPNHDRMLFLERSMKVINACLSTMCDECATLLKKYFRARFLGEKLRALAMDMESTESGLRTKIHRSHKKLKEQPAYRALLEEYEQP